MSDMAFVRGRRVVGRRRSDRGPVLIPPLRVLAQDDFASEAGTLLENHAAPGGFVWAQHPASGAGSASIDAGRVHTTNDAALHLYTHSWVPRGADYAVEADFVLVTDNIAAIVAVAGRIDPAVDSCYFLRFAAHGDAWQLGKRVAGVQTLLGSPFPQLLTVGQRYRAKIVMSGDLLTGFADGLAVASAVDAAIAAPGRAGLFFSGAATASTGLHVDGWRVRR